MATASELPITTGTSAMTMAESMFGSGIKIVSASYSGDPLSCGVYSNGLATAPGVVPSDSGVILSTGKAADITNSVGDVNTTASKTTNTKGVDNDADLNEVAGAKTFDAAIFKASFVPQGSVLTMQVTFSSEEYLEYCGSGFNDAVGVWVNGEKATLTVGDGDISINNINNTSNSALFVDNRIDGFNTEMDGFTVTLTLKAPVVPGQVNTIKIGIADGGDASYDSNLLIAGDSIQCAVVAQDDTFELALKGDGQTTVDLLGNDSDAAGGKLTITKINGQPVHAGSTVTLPNGVEVLVNADGTITLTADGDENLGEANFSYEVKNQNGVTDVGFVKGEVVACFVAGARIETDRGPVPVEQIAPGDRVLTLDHGLQVVRWVGRRRVVSAGALAAVQIPAGAFGDHGALRVSPQHRLYLAGWRAELHCGLPEVLVKAIHLVRAGRLRQEAAGQAVDYCHLLFDRHEIICAEGLWSESFHPGPCQLAAADANARDELFTLFPELRHDPLHGYGAIARPEAPGALAALLV